MKPAFDSLCVVGLGYVGLPTAAIFASRGLSVLGVDVNPATVESINKGKAPIVEPDLDIMVSGAVAAGRLRAAMAPAPADAFIIAVPTPFGPGHKPDLSHVEAAARSIGRVVKKGDLVVVESTSPVGTTETVSAWMAEARPDLRFPHDHRQHADVCVAHSPERVLPGRVLIELVRNDRVIGGVNPRCAERARELYRLAVAGECFLTSARTAELVKLAENAYRDANIAFANELSLICGQLGIDVWDTVRLANRHPRVSILEPGPGVGGHCIAVDPWFLVDSAPDVTHLIRAARMVNDGMPADVVRRILERAVGIARPRVACLGLAYKADIDDLRQSPAVEVVRLLAAELGGRGEVLAVEPYVRMLPDALARLPGVRLAEAKDAIAAADVVALLVDHRPFKDLDRARLAGKAVVDTRGVWR